TGREGRRTRPRQRRDPSGDGRRHDPLAARGADRRTRAADRAGRSGPARDPDPDAAAPRREERAMKVAPLLAMAILASGAWHGFASARPTDVIHPGGVPVVEDTLVFDYPVIQSPSLLSLRAPSLLEVG